MNPATELSATAIHEAGDVVGGRALGLVMGQASVEQDEGSVGHSMVADPHSTLGFWWECHRDGRTLRSALRARALMFMAGAEAETTILGRCSGGDGDDRREVAHALDETRDDEARMRRLARQFVRPHRAAIERVAANLEESRTFPAPTSTAWRPTPS